MKTLIEIINDTYNNPRVLDAQYKGIELTLAEQNAMTLQLSEELCLRGVPHDTKVVDAGRPLAKAEEYTESPSYVVERNQLTQELLVKPDAPMPGPLVYARYLYLDAGLLLRFDELGLTGVRLGDDGPFESEDWSADEILARIYAHVAVCALLKNAHNKPYHLKWAIRHLGSNVRFVSRRLDAITLHINTQRGEVRGLYDPSRSDEWVLDVPRPHWAHFEGNISGWLQFWEAVVYGDQL